MSCPRHPEDHFAEAIEEGLVEVREENGVRTWGLTDAGAERLSTKDVKTAFYGAVDAVTEETGIPQALVAHLFTEVGVEVWDLAERDEAFARGERRYDSLVEKGLLECRVSEEGKKLYSLSDRGYHIGRVLYESWVLLTEKMDELATNDYGVSREEAESLQALFVAEEAEEEA